MSLRRRWDTIVTILNIFALAIVFLFFAREFVLPFIAEKIYKEQYKELVFQCDNVMRDHFIAKTEILTLPSNEAIQKLHASEIGLLTCHDYDMLRKKLINFGLGENQLARIELEVVEERAKDVRPFVQTHEIRY
jgi:hypothetical protein